MGNYHICSVVKSSVRVSAWIRRTFLSRERGLMKLLLVTLLVPKLEYASVVWSPFDTKHITMLKNVQRRFTSKIWQYQTWREDLQKHICTVGYTDRLKDLKIYSLERRRERFLILYATNYKKFVDGYIACFVYLMYAPFPIPWVG